MRYIDKLQDLQLEIIQIRTSFGDEDHYRFFHIPSCFLALKKDCQGEEFESSFRLFSRLYDRLVRNRIEKYNVSLPI